MPKAIEHAHEAILAAARRLLEAEGYGKLSMRSIASAGGLATGTLYNYYGAKDEIVFALMKTDWEAALGRMDEVVEGLGASAGLANRVDGTADRAAETTDTTGTAEALLALFRVLMTFTGKYSAVWRQMALMPPSTRSPQLRSYDRSAIIGEMTDRVHEALTRGGLPGQDASLLATFLARVFSVYAMDTNPDQRSLEMVIMKLLRP